MAQVTRERTGRLGGVGEFAHRLTTANRNVLRWQLVQLNDDAVAMYPEGPKAFDDGLVQMTLRFHRATHVSDDADVGVAIGVVPIVRADEPVGFVNGQDDVPVGRADTKCLDESGMSRVRRPAGRQS